MAQESVQEKWAHLEWVGMRDIELPLLLQMSHEKLRLPARATAQVSLDKQASRGIHMSRLYLLVQEQLTQNILTPALLAQVTREFLQSHADLSRQALVELQFEYPLMRKALKSANQAWRTYPVRLSAKNNQGEISAYLEVLVTYSSTCPASAALARQLIQENFAKSFAGQTLDFEKVNQWLGTPEGILATPHAQRSFARVKIEFKKETAEFPIEVLIDLVEEALQTAVQGAVKREDEQEFALRNGQNLMFCEDAARRVKKALDAVPLIVDYVAEFNHVESLHPHSAVSMITKGIELKTF